MFLNLTSLPDRSLVMSELFSSNHSDGFFSHGGSPDAEDENP
jgi:hypothetical protein